ncbi:MAG: hypothetical protein H0Z37_00675 [Firmicutes bacterium]|nr:hypothetical protein [Bacillota bacterium]
MSGSELRQDPATGRWVIVAPARARRPGAERARPDFRKAGPKPERSVISARDPICPFCPGNEEQTPPEVYRLPGKAVTGAVGGTVPAGDGNGARWPGDGASQAPWRVRVVPNRFPMLSPAEGPQRRSRQKKAAREPGGVCGSGPFAARPAAGAHEVIIETPDHSRHPADMEDDELAAVLGIYRERYRALASRPGIRYVSLFRNHGREAGASQAHPHAQAVALPLVPPDVRARWRAAARYARRTGRCLYCDLLEAERDAQARWLWDNGAFAAFCAHAPRVAYEMWVAPIRHQADFALARDDELALLAQALGRALRALKRLLDDPPYNLVLLSGSPAGDGLRFHWHWQILPRMTRPAGFELGTGMAVVPVTPEQAASDLRSFTG